MKKKLSLFLVLMLMASLLAGCGGGSEDSSESPSNSGKDTENTDRNSSSDKAPDNEGETLKIGVVAPLTGTNKLVGEYTKNGVEMAVDEINSSGGVLGKQIEIVYGDEVDSLQNSVNATTMLLSDDSIVGIVGTMYSQYSIAVMPEVEAAGVPYFASGSSSGIPNENNPYTWQVRPVDTFQGITMADFAVNTLDMKNPAIMYSTQSTFASLSEQTQKALQDEGLEITDANLFGFPEEETNYAPYFAQILAGDYDGIIALSNQMPAALIMQQAEIAGVDPEKIPCLGSTSYCSNVAITNGGSSSNGWYSIADWIPGGFTEAGAEFEDRYQEKYNSQSDLPSVEYYDAVYLIKEACEKSGSTDREAINEALKEIKNYPGAISTFSYFDDHVFATSLGITRNIDETPTMIESVTFREP